MACYIATEDDHTCSCAELLQHSTIASVQVRDLAEAQQQKYHSGTSLFWAPLKLTLSKRLKRRLHLMVVLQLRTMPLQSLQRSLWVVCPAVKCPD